MVGNMFQVYILSESFELYNAYVQCTVLYIYMHKHARNTNCSSHRRQILKHVECVYFTKIYICQHVKVKVILKYVVENVQNVQYKNTSRYFVLRTCARLKHILLFLSFLFLQAEY